MKRKIKYRCWDNKRKEFVNVAINKLGRPVAYTFFNEVDTRQLIKVPMTMNISLYTGLKDKRGTEIYGGDIVYSSAPLNNRFVVDTFEFDVMQHLKEFASTYYLVAGNRYENPELLKSKRRLRIKYNMVE